MIQVGDIYRVALNYEVQGQQCFNVFHIRSTQAALSEAAIQSGLTAVGTKVNAIVDAWIPHVQPEVVFLGGGVSGIMGQHPHMGLFDIGKAGTAAADEEMPTFCAAVIHISTGLAGRRRRGRMHIGGLSDGHVDASHISEAGVTMLTAIRAAYLTQFGSGASLWRLGVYSRTTHMEEMEAAGGNPVLPDNSTAWADAIGLGINEIIGTMYSRKVGVGV
jgi:hypothetical protein